MAKPSDYRYDPFADIPSSITLTERHLIPSISPYIVSLGEVPVKSAPSTTMIKYINNFSGGQPVYGDTLTEVSATPTSGQYYPDYHTNAENNAAWNTGQIAFSASDAGRLIEVTYLAKGTLTGINSNSTPAYWTDRGSGSDGDFYPTSDVTIGGRRDFRSVFIPSGVTVYVYGFLDIRCQGFFCNYGTIMADAGGAPGGSGGIGNKNAYTAGERGYDSQGGGRGGNGSSNYLGGEGGGQGGLGRIGGAISAGEHIGTLLPFSYTHLRAHET